MSDRVKNSSAVKASNARASARFVDGWIKSVRERVTEILQNMADIKLTVGEDIDGLVVEVEEGMHAAPHALHGPVAGEDVGVELQVPGHVVPLEQASLLLLVGVHGAEVSVSRPLSRHASSERAAETRLRGAGRRRFAADRRPKRSALGLGGARATAVLGSLRARLGMQPACAPSEGVHAACANASARSFVRCCCYRWRRHRHRASALFVLFVRSAAQVPAFVISSSLSLSLPKAGRNWCAGKHQRPNSAVLMDFVAGERTSEIPHESLMWKIWARLGPEVYVNVIYAYLKIML